MIFFFVLLFLIRLLLLYTSCILRAPYTFNEIGLITYKKKKKKKLLKHRKLLWIELDVRFKLELWQKEDLKFQLLMKS